MSVLYSSVHISDVPFSWNPLLNTYPNTRGALTPRGREEAGELRKRGRGERVGTRMKGVRVSPQTNRHTRASNKRLQSG